MDDIDAGERGEIRSKPTTAQEALEIYRRQLSIRAREKDYNYAHTANSTCKIIQQFVEHFGPNRHIRECTETDLREFYQILCFRPTVHKNTAGSLIGRIQGMLKAAQKARPDLANWQRPTLKVSNASKFERRVVEPWEYATLVRTLLDPPLVRSQQDKRNALWRDTADVVQLLRMSGGRLNEVLRMKLNQFMWSKGKFRLYATKTENQRDLPLWNPIREVVQRRINEGLTDGEYLFPRAKTKTADSAISEACRVAGEAAKLSYGLANGLTCHSLRHTFITKMMEATDKDVAQVMEWSGQKSLQSFKIYLHPSEKGRILGAQHTDSVADFLRTFTGRRDQPGDAGAISQVVKPLKRKQVRR